METFSLKLNCLSPSMKGIWSMHVWPNWQVRRKAWPSPKATLKWIFFFSWIRFILKAANISIHDARECFTSLQQPSSRGASAAYVVRFQSVILYLWENGSGNVLEVVIISKQCFIEASASGSEQSAADTEKSPVMGSYSWMGSLILSPN